MAPGRAVTITVESRGRILELPVVVTGKGFGGLFPLSAAETSELAARLERLRLGQPEVPRRQSLLFTH